MKDKHTCPICKGKGHLEVPFLKRKASIQDKHSVAFLLREEGYSIRQIMRFLGYKSPNTVQELLKGKS